MPNPIGFTIVDRSRDLIRIFVVTAFIRLLLVCKFTFRAKTKISAGVRNQNHMI